MTSSDKKIVVILGQTASGKSSLALSVAQQFDGEILCADSRTIYKDMNIGTAKPSAGDQNSVLHHGLDLINPTQSFSAAEFKDYATQTVRDIWQRDKLPIIVGGSGLYIDSYVYDFSFTGKPDQELRNTIESLTLLQLQQRAIEFGVSDDDSSFHNHRHLSRVVERAMSGSEPQTRGPKPANILLLGLRVPREQLLDRITVRVDTMFGEGLVDEVKKLVMTYGREAPGLRAPGYASVAEYIDGNLSLEQSTELIIRGHKNLAKRQLTWFKRNPDIVWCSDPEEGIKKIRAFLS